MNDLLAGRRNRNAIAIAGQQALPDVAKRSKQNYGAAQFAVRCMVLHGLVDVAVRQRRFAEVKEPQLVGDDCQYQAGRKRRLLGQRQQLAHVLGRQQHVPQAAAQRGRSTADGAAGTGALPHLPGVPAPLLPRRTCAPHGPQC